MRFSKLCALSAFTSLATLAGACGGGDDDAAPVDGPTGNTNPGFITPTAVTKANQQVGGEWTEIGDADWSCLNTPSTDQPSTQAIALSGELQDFQTGGGVSTGSITAFPGIMLGGNAGTTTSAADGAYTMNVAMLPSGETRYGFKFEADGYVKTYLLNQYLEPGQATQTRNMDAVSEGTATALPAFIGVTRDVTKGVLAGAFRDCAGNEVSNAVATVSGTAGEAAHLLGAKTFYFSAGSSSLPVRHNVSPVMNKDGLFVILDLPPQSPPAFVQVWGFRDAADLADGQMTLLSELASPIEENAIITGSFEPLRAD